MPEHKDKYNRTIQPGQLVCWATGWSQGPKIGRVIKVCDKRIRIEQKYGGSYTYHILQQPERIIVLDDSLQHTLTMEVLKNTI